MTEEEQGARRSRTKRIKTGAVIGKGRYFIKEELGHGGFGTTFRAEDVRNFCEDVAIKTSHYIPPPKPPRNREESENDSDCHASVASAGAYDLENEYNALLHLKNIPGFPQVIELNSKGQTYLVMELLGRSLHKVCKDYKYLFSIQTILILTDQLIARLESLHGRGMVHGDLKPDNILLGTGENSGIVYLIDFGITTMWKDLITGDHLPLRENLHVIGTPTFMSVNVHERKQPSRRDDMESLAYVIAYFSKHSDLPWSKYEGDRESSKLINRMKDSMTGATLFAGQPREFAIFYEKVRNLKYQEKPDYQGYRKMFRMLGVILGVDYSGGGARLEL